MAPMHIITKSYLFLSHFAEIIMFICIYTTYNSPPLRVLVPCHLVPIGVVAINSYIVARHPNLAFSTVFSTTLHYCMCCVLWTLTVQAWSPTYLNPINQLSHIFVYVATLVFWAFLMLAISCSFFRRDGGFLARVVERAPKVPLDLEAANAGSNPEVELRVERDTGSREPGTNDQPSSSTGTPPPSYAKMAVPNVLPEFFRAFTRQQSSQSWPIPMKTPSTSRMPQGTGNGIGKHEPTLQDYLARRDWSVNLQKDCSAYKRRASKDCQDLERLLQDVQENPEVTAEIEMEFSNLMSLFRAAEERHPVF